MLGSRHKGCSLFNAGKSNRASIEGYEESVQPYGRGRLLAGMYKCGAPSGLLDGGPEGSCFISLLSMIEANPSPACG